MIDQPTSSDHVPIVGRTRRVGSFFSTLLWIFGVIIATVIGWLAADTIAGAYAENGWDGAMASAPWTVPVVLVAAAVWGLAIRRQLRARQFSATALATLGTVTNVEIHNTFDTQDAEIELQTVSFRFRDAQKIDHLGRERIHAPTPNGRKRYAVGDPIEIVYLPDNPARCVPAVVILTDAKA